jgi:hypothetical protein
LTATTGSGNIGIGYSAGNNITSGTRNVVIGTDINAPSATADNQLAISNYIFGTGMDGTENTISAGKVGFGLTSPNEKVQVDSALAVGSNAEGNTGRLTLRCVRESVTLAGAGTKDTATAIFPSGSQVLGAQFNVDTTVTDGGAGTWSAANITGDATTWAAAGTSGAVNTKVNKLIVPVITTAATPIRFTASAGNFTGGVIEVLIYYYELTAMANA